MVQKQKSKKHRFRALMYLFIWLFTAVAFSGVIIMQISRYNVYRDELSEKETALENERRINKELIEQMDFYEDDAYIEQIAREQLGYVMPDEIIFQNESD